MENIDKTIREYIKTRAERLAAEKREKALAAEIQRYADGRDGFVTKLYRILFQRRTRRGLDTKRLYAELPGIENEYALITEYTVIDAHELTPEERRERERRSA